jgi:hypothetical protein
VAQPPDRDRVDAGRGGGGDRRGCGHADDGGGVRVGAAAAAAGGVGTLRGPSTELQPDQASCSYRPPLCSTCSAVIASLPA